MKKKNILSSCDVVGEFSVPAGNTNNTLICSTTGNIVDFGDVMINLKERKV